LEELVVGVVVIEQMPPILGIMLEVVTVAE
jgi:hypothetical protein